MGLMTAKYIKTASNRMIVFSASLKHSDFRNFNPVSAGFISFGVDKEGNPDCSCYGKSESLDIESHADDTMLAKRHILDNF